MSNIPIELHTFVLVFAGIFGAVIGSFFNAVAWRVPNEVSIADGRSVCPHCKAQLRWYHNIPIVSYLFLRGRCGFCQTPIGVRYLLLELFCAGSTVANLLWFQRWEVALWASVFVCLLAVLSAIDLETMLLPDVLTIPGAAAMLAFSFWQPIPISWQESMIAGFGAFFMLWGISAAFKALRGVDGLGFGDVKLMLMIGFTLGITGVIDVLIIGSLGGAIIGGGVTLVRGGDSQTHFPFGPFLAAAAMATLWFRPWIDGVLFPTLQ